MGRVIFETERLVVREWAESDGDRVFDIYRRWEVARWLGAEPQVMTDREASYPKISVPMLGLASEFSYDFMRYVWAGQGTDVRVHKVPGTGYFLAEENPDAVLAELTAFFG